MSWSDRAVCRPEHRSFFYPEGTPLTKAALTEKAKRLCSICPVRDDCLEYALVNEAYGTWGGLTEVEREVLRLERGLPALLPARFHQKNVVLRKWKNEH